MIPKLFMVVSYLGRGGTERNVLDFCRAAHPDHADCTVVCLSDVEGELADEVRATGARVVMLGIRRPRYFRGIGRYIRLLRRLRPDAVYAIGFHQYCITLPITRAVLPSAARIAGRHHVPEFDTSPVPAARRLRFLADRVSEVVIGNSEAVRDAWLVENPRLRDRLIVVPNGLQMVDAEPEPPPASGRRRIVCTARLVDWKGHRILIDALGQMKGRDDWHADLIGDGPERDAIERQIASLGLGDRVTLHGSVAPERVHEIVAGSDVAVLPSFGEGMPNAVMEAMSHGVAAVATDVAGVRELLGSGAGLIVPPGDPAAIAEALMKLLDDDDLRRSSGAEGLRVITERHSIPSMRDAKLAAIREAIAAH